MNNRKTKIICTIGPSSNTYEKIKSLTLAGMDVARLNFSHGTHDDHLKNIQIIRQVSDELQKPIAILQDLQGPKIRIQKFENGNIKLSTGQEFTLTIRDVIGNNKIVSVSYPEFINDVNKGDTILLDDGLINIKVKEILDSDVICDVIFGGDLKDHKGLNLPGSTLSVDTLTEKDFDDLAFGVKQNVDYVALSFVQKAEDVSFLKSLLSEMGRDIPVVAKIEKPQAVHCIDEITNMADAIMVARGDLGVEVSAEEVPSIQKRIIKICNQKGIPVITATQMLDSMIYHPRPTRAETSDVANAVIDGSDAVMLSGETASGRFPVKSVHTMERIINLIENDNELTESSPKRRRIDRNYLPELAIGHAACEAAELLNADAIICVTQSGSTARTIARFRPKNPIIAITSRDETLFRMALIWGVTSYSVEEFKDNIDDAICDIKKILLEKKILKSGDKVIITAGLPFSIRRKTNMLRIEEI